jgi:hypothetical protein
VEKMNAMSLKAKIRNIAKAKNVSAQIVLQNFFFERFLIRLSQEKFILKGGLLIATMTGLDARSTMDMDATIHSLPLDEEHIRTAVEAVCVTPIEDGVIYQITGITFIREDNEYGGLRISQDVIYENINAPLSIDITAGDAITPKPIKKIFKSVFNDTEPILAEKVRQSYEKRWQYPTS